MTVSAHIFDLDGTLLDSAGQLAQFANEVLARHGFRPQPLAELRARAGQGAAAMLALAGAEQLRDYFLSHYRETSPLFAGVREKLAQLPRWAIVSNKPRRLIADALTFNGLRPEVFIGGDELRQPKPAPEGLLRCCELLKVKPETALYVGDDASDYEASRRAQMPFIGVGEKTRGLGLRHINSVAEL